MALTSDSTTTALSVHHALDEVQRFASEWFSPHVHSPEQDLLSGPVRDARLLPRAPMSHEHIDVGVLSNLSSIGLKRAKLVTEQSHPELMQAWRIMAARAGLPKTPQLIIAESDSLNALTMTKDEVTITTGLLKLLDLRETTAVLGHELGHVAADHVTPRITATAIFGGAGVVAGDMAGRYASTYNLNRQLAKWKPTEPLSRWMGGPNVPRGILGRIGIVGLFVAVGNMIANQVSVRPTELDSDARGAAISGDPQALASALQVLKDHSPKPTLMSTIRRWQSGYPTLETRIDKLRGLPQGVPVVAAMSQMHAPQVSVTDTAMPQRPTTDQPRAAVQMATTERLAGPTTEPALT